MESLHMRKSQDFLFSGEGVLSARPTFAVKIVTHAISITNLVENFPHGWATRAGIFFLFCKETIVAERER